ncbi:PAS domain S-box protein [Thermodesulfobacteriota bacterium]
MGAKPTYEELEQRIKTLEAEQVQFRKANEGAFKEEEELFQSLSENSPNMIFINKGGRVVYANKRCEEVTGYKKEEFYSENFDFVTLIAPEHRDVVKDNFQRHMKGEEIEPYEYAIVTKDGKKIETMMITKLVDYKEGKAILGTVPDITAVKRNEEELRNSEEIARTLLTANTDPAFLADREGVVLATNHFAAERLGKSMDEFIGKCAWDLMPPEQKQKTREIVDELIQSKNPVHYEEELEGKYFYNSFYPVFDVKGSVERIAFFARDITNIKIAEQAVKESEKKYRDLVENINDVIYAIDIKGMVTYVSPVIESVIGYRPEEMIGHDYRGFVRESDQQIFSEQFQRVLSGEKVLAEYRVQAKSGEIHWLRASNRAIYSGDRVVGVQGVFYDITDRKIAEEALKAERDRTQRYLDIAGVIIVALDRQGSITLINKKGCELLGSEEKDIIGKGWFDHFIPDRMRDEVKEVFHELMNEASEPIEYYDNPVLVPGGDECLIAWKNHVLKGKSGEFIGTLSSGLDITDRKKAEDALRESEEKYRLLVENATDAIFIAQDEVIKFPNPRTEEMVGYSTKELANVPFIDFIHPEDREMAKKYHPEYNEKEPVMFYPWLYAVSMVATEAMKRAGRNLTRESFVNAMETIKNFDTGGLLPAISYGPGKREACSTSRALKVDLDKKSFVPVTGWIKPKFLK